MKKEKQILEFCPVGLQTMVWLRATTIDEFLQSGVFNIKVKNNDGTLKLPFDVGNNDVFKLVVNDNPSNDKLQVERFVVQTLSYVRRDTGENISYTRYRSNVSGVPRWTSWAETGVNTVCDINDGAVTLEKLSPDVRNNMARSLSVMSELEGNVTILFHTATGTHPYGCFFLKKNYNYRFVFEETGYTSPLYKALINNKDRATLVNSTTGGEFSYRPTEDVEAYLSLYSGSEGDVTVAVTSLPVLQKEIADNLGFEAMPVVPSVVKSKYTKYDDGVPTSTGTYFTQFRYKVASNVGRYVKINSYSPNADGAIVAFYSSDDASAESYLKEQSIRATGGYEVVDVVIPDGAVLMVVTHRNVDGFTKPVVLMKGLVDNPCSSVANKADISALADVVGALFPSSYICGYYNTATGNLVEANSTNTAVSEVFIKVESNTEYVVENIEGYKLCVYLYDAEKAFVKNIKWFSDGNEFVTEADTAYVRIALRKENIVLSEIPTVSVVKNDFKQIQDDYAVASIYNLSKGGYVKYEDGSFVLAGIHWKYAKVDVEGLRDIIAVCGALYDNVAAPIAFYTADGVYIKEHSVQGYKGAGLKISALVPDNAEYAICCAATSLEVMTHSIGAVVENIPQKYVDPLKAFVNPFVSKPFYHHLNQEQVAPVPAQSLYDIAYAKALGFSVIEANVHKCADGVYVTKHGNSGKLGAGLVFAEGSGITADTAFVSVTSADLRTYVTYDTPLPQYAGHIPTLDEFCAECKRLGMMILLRVMNDNASLDVARKYFPDGEIILCGATERGDFKGLITTFQNVDDTTTVESVLNICEDFGKPYMFGGFWSSSMSDDKVREIVTALHENGYLAGAAYAETLAIRRLAGLGVDMFASMADVNLFDTGNVNNVFSFDKFDIESGDVALENGVANMSQGAVLRLSDAAFENNHGKVLVGLLFDGELNVQFGNIKAYTVASDGTEWVTMARVIGRSSRVVGFEAKTDTVIKGVKVLSSVVI